MVEKMPEWPSDLGKMRYFCKFWKNGSYRRHCSRKLDLDRDEVKSLRHFTASFAKWRYETVFEVLSQLGQKRNISGKLSPALFAHAQDQEEMAHVMRACQDLPFWRWAEASFKEVLVP